MRRSMETKDTRQAGSDPRSPAPHLLAHLPGTTAPLSVWSPGFSRPRAIRPAIHRSQRHVRFCQFLSVISKKTDSLTKPDISCHFLPSHVAQPARLRVQAGSRPCTFIQKRSLEFRNIQFYAALFTRSPVPHQPFVAAPAPIAACTPPPKPHFPKKQCINGY